MSSSILTAEMVAVARHSYEVGTDLRKATESSANLVASLQRKFELAPDKQSKRQIEEAMVIGLIAEQMAKFPKEGEASKLIKRKVSDDALDEAALVFFSLGKDAKEAKAGVRQRDEAEERWYTNARSAKRTILKLANIGTVSSQGGDRSSTATATTESEASGEPTKQQAPAVVDRPAAYKWLSEETAVLNAFVLRNKPHMPEEVIKLVDQFRKDLIAAMKD